MLFTHNEGYSTMCGHATIALGRYAIEHGLVPAAEPVTRFAIEAPCGLLRLECTVRDGKVDSVVFESVPAFVFARDLAVALPGYGDIVTDIAYGGAFYCILPASRFGLDLFETPVTALTDAAAALTDHLRASLPITHPSEPDLGFLYGTIITDEAQAHDESFNLCIFAEAQIDRSPTGSGVTARMALDHAKGFVETGHPPLPQHHRRHLHRPCARPRRRFCGRGGHGRGRRHRPFRRARQLHHRAGRSPRPRLRAP